MTEQSPDDPNNPPGPDHKIIPGEITPGETPPAEITPAADPGSSPTPAHEPPIQWPSAETPSHPDIFGVPLPPQKTYPRRIPHLGHAVLFFVIALVLLVIGQLIGTFVIQWLQVWPHRGFDWVFRKAATDTRASIPIQAFSYGLIALVSVPVFSVLWDRLFGDGIHWNNRSAWRRFLPLVILGLIVGTGISFIGNFMPMPANPPITQDMMKSAAGAWAMLVFGITVAPLLEELAFRGFLLPGLLNAFRWFADRDMLPAAAAKWAGIPVSIILTSAAFAFMHSPQVSHAWGPLLLIGSVSVILCVIRLAMNSVMASVLVHAAYNFTLFAGVLYQTQGFQHLNKLTG